jgi:DNA-binding MarR family transcriptional regulator
MSSTRRTHLNAANARYYPPPEGAAADDQLLNVSAICVEFRVNYWTFKKRQQRGWPALSGGKLLTHMRQWGRPGEPGNRWEETYLRSEVSQVLAARKPDLKGGRFLVDGEWRLTMLRVRRELGSGRRMLNQQTLDKLRRKGLLPFVPTRLPGTGVRPLTCSETALLAVKAARAQPVPDRVQGPDGWYVLRRSVLAQLGVTGETLRQWSMACPYPGPNGEGLRSLSVPGPRGGQLTYYHEEDVARILAARAQQAQAPRVKRHPPPAAAARFDGRWPDGRINLALASRLSGVPRTSMVKYIRRGWLGAEKRWPEGVRFRSRAEYAVLLDEVLRLRQRLQAAARAGRPPGDWKTASEIARLLHVQDRSERIMLGMLLRMGRERGAIPCRRPELPIQVGGGQCKRAWLYDRAAALRFLEDPQGQPSGRDGHDAATAVLSGSQQDVLDALYDWGAVSSAMRASLDEVAQRRALSRVTVGHAAAKLRGMGLIATERGPGGGCWLTEAGRVVAEKNRQ